MNEKWRISLQVNYPRPRLRGRVSFGLASALASHGLVKVHHYASGVFAGLAVFTARGGEARVGSGALASTLGFVARLFRSFAGLAGFAPSARLAATAVSAPTSYVHLLVTGQSLSAGAANGIVSTTQPSINKMFTSGPLGADPDAAVASGHAVTVPVNYSSVVPLVATLRPTWNPGETYGECPAVGLANHFGSVASRGVMVSSHGISGMTYASLKKGSAAYADGLAQVSAAKSVFAGLGKTLSGVPGIAIMHGESDNWNQISGYESKLIEWQNDYETDIKAITGQGGTIPIFIYQMCATGPGRYTPAPTPGDPGVATAIAALKAYRANPDKIVLVGPNYPWVRNDGIHLRAHGYRSMGVTYARVMKRVLSDGARWVPLMPIAITRTGRVIDVQYHVPTGPLVFDEVRALNPGNFGFGYRDDASSATVESVSIISADTVRITLDVPPTGTNKLVTYGWAETGFGAIDGPFGAARGCLRDSHVEPNAYGYDSFNWGVLFADPVT